MAIAPDISTAKGFDALLRMLDGLPDVVRDRAVGLAMRRGANVIRDAAARNCPVSVDGSHGHAPGTLRANIKTRLVKLKQSRSTRRVVGAQVRSEVPRGKPNYSTMVENGHYVGGRTKNVDLGIKKGKRRTEKQRELAKARDMARKHIPGVYYMRRAKISTANAVVPAMIDTIKRSLPKIVADYAHKSGMLPPAKGGNHGG